MLSRWKKLRTIPTRLFSSVLNITDINLEDQAVKKPSRKLVMDYLSDHIHSTTNAVSVVFTIKAGVTAMYVTYPTGETSMIEFHWKVMQNYSTFADYLNAMLSQSIRVIRVDYKHTHEFAN